MPSPRWLSVVGVLLAAAALGGQQPESTAGNRATVSLDPVDPARATVRDLLRGHTDEELRAARALFPPRPERASGPPVARRVTVNGTVFLDTDRDGRFDEAEPTVPDVVVSDGDVVIRSDARGQFSFAFPMGGEAHHRFVFITRPTGYETTNSFFHRIPFDEDVTGYTAAFGIAEHPPSRRDRFWFITQSDTQVSDVRQMIPLAKDYAQMTDGPERPAFLVTAGDLTSQGTHAEWDAYDVVRGAARVPVYDGYGGHDGNGLRPRSTINYEWRVGPPSYSFEYGGVHFVHFVTEDNHLRPEARARQHRWLDRDLKAIPPGTRVIAISHYPLPGEWFDRRRAEGVNVIAQLAGHFHTVMAGSRNGTPVLSSSPAGEPDWGAYGRPYRRVYVAPEGLTSEIRIPGQYQRLELVAPGSSALLGSQPVVVLAYDSARTVERITCRATSPDGTIATIALEKRGDWSWHGRFTPSLAGAWRFDLEAGDTAGVLWRRSQTIAVKPLRAARPDPGRDFPWLLAGDPPRRVPQAPGASLYPLWVRHTGGVHVRHASPAVWNGRVYVAIPNPNAGVPGSGVLCLDARTGKEIWRASTPMGDIAGAVTVHRGRVYALTGEGWVSAFDALTGRPVWQVPLAEDDSRGRPLGATYSMPVPTEQGLLVSDRERPPVLLDYRTGRIRGLAGSKPPDKYGAFITVHNGTMYSAQSDRQVATPLFGREPLWERPDDLKSSAGVVVNGSFFFTGCCADGSNVAKAIDAATGTLTWESALPNPELSMSGTVNDANPVPVVWRDLVLANGRDFAALDVASGRVRWTVECGRSPDRFARSQRHVLTGHSSPVVAGELAYFGHDDTSVRAVTFQGEVVWEYVVGTPVNTSPASSGNLLFVHDYAGNLWCFAPAAGK